MDLVNINESISISSLISRIETNKSFYGRFEIGPFAHGQGITVANMLRRTLLSELNGLAITAVEIQGASHEYMTLPGMSESIQDVILNLKLLIFRSDFDLKQQEFGFLCIQGPAVVKACHFRLPSFIKCVDPDQYIATLAFNGQLNLKVQICQGKNYKFQTPLDLNWPGSGVLSSTQSSHIFEKQQKAAYLSKNETISIINSNAAQFTGFNQSISKQDHRFNIQSEYTQQKSEYFSKFSNSDKSKICNQMDNSMLKSKLKNISSQQFNFPKKDKSQLEEKASNFVLGGSIPQTEPILNKEILTDDAHFKKSLTKNHLHKKQNLSGLVKYASTNQKIFKVSDLTIAKNEANKREIFYKSRKNSEFIQRDNKLRDFNLEYSSKQKIASIKEIEKCLLKTDNILSVDAIFTPVTKVNYLISLDEKVKPFKEQVLLEVWTNGSITPKTAVYKAADYLLELILPLSKSTFH